MTDLITALGNLFRGDTGGRFERNVRTAGQFAPYAAAGAEAYMNPASVLRTLSRPAKQDFLKLFRDAIQQSHGGKSTSAIKMAYGKRRNNRSKRRSYSRKPNRKRTGGRRRKSSSALLSSLHKALSAQMA